MDPEEEWRLYGFTCVQFGDCPAATLMTIAVEKASETYEDVAVTLNIDKEVVKEDTRKLLLDTYIEDGTTGGRVKDVFRMLGEKLPDGTYTGTISRMMESIGLHLKTIVSTSDPDPESAEKLSSKVLGYLFDVNNDHLSVKFVFNPSKKRKGLKSSPDLTMADMDRFHESSTTRRALLSVVNGVYDPLGIASPYTIKLKLLMKSTIAQQDVSDWDSPVPDKIIKEWVDVIKEGILMDSLLFPRSTVNRRAIKKPKLVGFWDGSSQAFAGAVYVVSMVSKDEDYYEENL